MKNFYCKTGKEVRTIIKKDFGSIPLKIKVKRFDSIGIFRIDIFDNRILGTVTSSNIKMYILRKNVHFSENELKFIKYLETTRFFIKL